jgi:uncharacterized protein (TIGR03000 family)
MSRQTSLVASLCAAVLVATNPVFAGGSSGRTTFGSASAYYRSTQFVPVYVPVPAAAGSYESTFFDLGNAARLHVRLPANADLWIEDGETRQRGVDRLFESPELTPGRDYAFHLKAEWTENGQKVTRTKKVPIHAGDVVHIDFLNAK